MLESDAAFKHMFMPAVPGLIACYVVGEEGHVTDMISFYFNDTLILTGEHKGGCLKAAYLFYTVAEVTPRKRLLNAAMAELFGSYHVDMINALDEMMGFEASLLRKLKFLKGNGLLHWYLYGAAPGQVPPEQ